MAHFLGYIFRVMYIVIVNLVKNEIFEGMSHSDPEKIEKRAKNFTSVNTK